MDNIVDILVRLDLRQPDQIAQGKIEKDKTFQGTVAQGGIAQGEDHCQAEDRFLIDEGLDLLAAYRAINDDGVRHAIRTLVEALAKADPSADKATG